MVNLSSAKKKFIFIIISAVICVGICSFGGCCLIGSTSTAFAADTQYKTDDPDAPAVYMTTEITPEALVNIYDALGFNAEGNVAVKMSTGEPPASNYLRPELIGDLVKKVDGTIVECNTAYGGSRSSTALHKQVAEDHGFTAIANVDIMDEDGSMTIPVPAPKSGASTITENYVGSHLENYDSLICLSHFKGHSMAGYGGAIKNMSIGVASSRGKGWIHSGGTSMTNIWGGKQDAFLEAMGDATSAVIDFMDGKVVYINVMNRLSVDCDCDGNPAEPDMHDIGILASTDPVAVDQACIDLIYEQKDGDGKSLVQRIESRNGLHTLEHAAEIGIGSRRYNLIDIDSEAIPTNDPAVTSSPASTARPQANMTYADGALTISNLEGGAKLIHASYTNGALSKFEISDAANGTVSVETRSGDKFMLWSAVGEMLPLCEAVTVETGTYENDPTPSAGTDTEEDIKMNVQIGDAVFIATLEDNTAAREFAAMMKEAPVTIKMSDYSGFEKVGSLGRSLTANNSQMTTVPGDIVLYNGNQIVMFYGSNSWSYTKLGHIDDLTGWEAALGSGDITAVFSVAD